MPRHDPSHSEIPRDISRRIIEKGVTLTGNQDEGFTQEIIDTEDWSYEAIRAGNAPGANSSDPDAIDNGYTILLDGIQSSLDYAGFLPGVGTGADLLNAGIHAARGNWTAAGIAAVASAPIVGDLIAGGKMMKKAGDAVGAAKTKIDDAIKSTKSKADELCNPNCFIAGTQVVLHVDHPLNTIAAAAVPEATAVAVADREAHDELFAAGAFVLMAGLSYQRRRAKRKRETKQMRLV